jgi:hypothetical protein
MTEPAEALNVLASSLRDDDSVISPHVVDPTEEPALGLLVAAGPRAAGSPGEYAVVFEAVREGYLLHYRESRLLRGHDSDLALLAGDYLYATGLERLAALDDLDAVRELSDLISLSAQVHAGANGDPAAAEALASPLWLAAATSVGVGGGAEAGRAKAALREGDAQAAARLRDFAHESAASAGITTELSMAAEAIGFVTP